MRAALVELNLNLATHTPATWQRPATARALRDYFVGSSGRWLLSKELSYVRGGVSGTFSGGACFGRLDEQWLAYSEQGRATLGEEGTTPQIFEASRRLLYDCSQPAGRVDCYFDEAADRTPRGVRGGARFFHGLQLPTAAAEAVRPFEHPCGPDLYRGRLVFVVRLYPLSEAHRSTRCTASLPLALMLPPEHPVHCLSVSCTRAQPPRVVSCRRTPTPSASTGS